MRTLEFAFKLLKSTSFHLKKPDIPINESERLKALSEYRILGTKPEENYDDITKIASLTCGTPIALLSLVDSDRQWFKAKVGIDAQETVRDWSFCAHAIHSSEPLIVEDALQDERFFDNPLVKGEPKIRLYAGFPLQNEENHRIGTLCVIDREPHGLTDVQLSVMQSLSRQAVAFLELRKRSIKLIESYCSLVDDGNIISTCSYCRKAKDTDGHWLHLDRYLSKRTNLNFSHGICDLCIEEHFPDVLEVWQSEEKQKLESIQQHSSGNLCGLATKKIYWTITYSD